MTTVTYTSTKSYIGNRPWADVELSPGSVAVVTLKCLVDTGADYLQINAADAGKAGISLSAATATSVATAAGMTTLQLIKGVTVSIEGSGPIVVDVLVDTANGTKPPLAGRQLLLKAFDIGFDRSQWLAT